MLLVNNDAQLGNEKSTYKPYIKQTISNLIPVPLFPQWVFEIE